MENCSRQSSSINWNQVIYGTVPLRRIFSHLERKHVKTARLVCRHWADVGANYLSGCTIFLDYYESQPQKIAEFLSNHGIQHILYLSTLPNPWDSVFQDCPSLKRLEGLDIKFKYSENLASLDPTHPGVLNTYFQISGHLVMDLRLETSLDDDRDLNFLTRIFQYLHNLVKVTLDISQHSGNMLLRLPSNLISPTTKTGTLRIYNEDGYFIHTEQSIKFVQMVERFLEFLDLSGWGKEGARKYYESEDVGNWISAVNGALDVKKNAFPCLRGFKGESTDDFLSDLIHRLSHPLEFINLRLPYVASSFIRDFNKLLVKNKEALRSLSIQIYGNRNDLSVVQNPPHYPFDPLDVQVDLYPLVKLQHLTLSLVDGATPPWHPQRWPQRLWDIYKLRQLLMDNLAPFPLLTSLSVFFIRPAVTEPRDEFWNFIFPQTDKNGEPLIIPGLKELVVSYCGGCDSEMNARIHSIFPNLRTFRHVKESRDDAVRGCEEYRNAEGVVSCKEFLVCIRKEVEFTILSGLLDKLLINRLNIEHNVAVWNQ